MQLPLGPGTAPLFQMMQWIFQPLAFMDSCKERYGNTFTIRLGSANARPLVFFSHPEAITELFTTNPEKFDTGRANNVLQPLLGRRSLELLDGKRHDKQRQLLMPPFHGERMRAYGQLISNITEQVTDRWVLGKPFTARNSMQAISFTVMGKALLGLEPGARLQQLAGLFDSIFNATSSSPLTKNLLFFPSLQKDLGAWSPWGNFLRQRQQLDSFLYEEIQQRRSEQDSDRTDILAMLMSARDEAGKPMSDLYLHSELMTLLFAGHETIATAMTWALYWIHHQPEVRQKLLQELAGISDRAEPAEITQLSYLNAVCQETLRIYPVGLITFPRIVKSDVEIGGYSFERGTVLTGCIYLAHQRPEVFPDPKQFKPERFLERQFSPYEYLPFGGGGRRCIGAAFASYIMKIVIAKILTRWELKLTGQKPARPARRGVTLAPQGGISLMATGRRVVASQQKDAIAATR